MTLDTTFDVEIIEEVFDVTIEDQQLLNVDLIVIDQIPGRPTSLTALGDVEITNLLNNQGLIYNEALGKWINQTLVTAPDPTKFVQGEVPSPGHPVLTPNKFTTVNNFASGTLEVFLNGMKLYSSDVTIYNNHQFSITIDTETEDLLTVNYIKA